ncbi:MAG: adenylate/guanylate cyclase domain-containing protein [Sulfuritalea sp.]|nr:adenylate/guanylate cyclase domain-containing protein [Sulfuritalea sp.]MDP1982277.1 adenylate/guanylate cyclase domain-containing protein [Sulfuritalea sp.]
MSAKPSALSSITQDNSDVLRERLSSITAAYSRFVPREFLNLLGIEDIRKVEVGQQVERKMTILFADIRNFTSLSETMSPQENFNFLNSYLIQMEPVITAHGGFIDKYVGDAIMALFPDSPDAALRCSLAMLEKLDQYNNGRQRAGYRPINIGIGINTGIVILGTVGGAARMDGTVIGDAVNLAARLERLTKEYRVSVLISENTLYCLDQPHLWSIRFLDRTRVRGKQGTQSVYEVFSADPAALREAKATNLKNFERALAYYHIDDILTARERLNAHVANVPQDEAAYVYLERCEVPAEGLSGTRVELPPIWREEYGIGTAVLDLGHKGLLAEMNALARTIHAGALDQTAPQMAQIQFSATRDFNIEDQMMKEDGYPFIDLHNRQHQRFFEYFNELRREIDLGENDRVYLGFRVKRFLTGWLINHVLSADRHYGHYRRSRSVNLKSANL